jgi:type IV pilus assembly protein PilB
LENAKWSGNDARRRASRRPSVRGTVLGILVSEGVVSRAEIGAALSESRARREDVENTLVSMGFATEKDLSRARAKRLGIPHENVDPKAVSPEALELLPEKAMRRFAAIPLRLDGEKLVVAMENPSNIYAVEDLRVISGREVSPVVAAADEITTALDALFDREERVRSEVLRETESADEASEPAPLVEPIPDDAPVVRLFDSLLRKAVSEGASDIHIEPFPGRLAVRYRIDGVLREAMSVPSRLASGLVTRVKVMADLDIAERRLPQDGRFSFESEGGKVDLRAASLPTVHGEGVVLRLLDAASLEVDFLKLGFPARDIEKYESIFRRPYGTILATGPTGSGKSTTLYATLAALNSPEKKIVTIEDPVEYRLSGPAQIQINPRAGLTFASGLRSILRADPDIVMIGEVRDSETARTAVEAALTGHMVLATLHTNDAPSALSRLTDMGVEPFLSASAVDCVIAQRLARKLCERCKRPANLGEKALAALGLPSDSSDKSSFFEAVGCEACAGTGYRGRIGVFEMMEVGEEIKSLIIARASSGEIGRAAEREGMTRLKDDGLTKAASGVTSIEEILRTVV